MIPIDYSSNFFLPFGGGKKFSFVITFFPVFCSKANLASLAILPPFLPAFAFCVKPFAYQYESLDS